jgi:CPA2 family monovalent cation:H+ antiporter-2
LRRNSRLVEWLDHRSERRGRSANASQAARKNHPTAARALVVGYGPVGRTVARRVEEFGLEPLVIDLNVDTILTLQEEGKLALYGDALRPEILLEGGIKEAAYLVVTIPDPGVATSIVTTARALSNSVRILARTRHMGEGQAFEQAGVVAVCYDEAEAATALATVLRADMKASGFSRT